MNIISLRDKESIKREIAKSLEVGDYTIIKWKGEDVARIANDPSGIASLFYLTFEAFEKCNEQTFSEKIKKINEKKEEYIKCGHLINIDFFDKAKFIDFSYALFPSSKTNETLQGIVEKVNAKTRTDERDVRSYLEEVKDIAIKELSKKKNIEKINGVEFTFEFELCGKKFYTMFYLNNTNFKDNLIKTAGDKILYVYSKEKIGEHPYFKELVVASELCKHLKWFNTTENIYKEEETESKQLKAYLKHIKTNTIKDINIGTKKYIGTYEDFSSTIDFYECNAGIYATNEIRTIEDKRVVLQYLFSDNQFVRDNYENVRHISSGFVPLITNYIARYIDNTNTYADINKTMITTKRVTRKN